jgi:serine/threonine-protein kinase
MPRTPTHTRHCFPAPAAAILTAMSDRRFGRYRVVATLGRGGMGEVFAAVDDVLGREVAIKTLRAGDARSRLVDARFTHEARAIAALSHPGVVQVFDLDAAADPPYLVMERVEGPSLSARLDAGALAVGEVRALGVQIALALAAAHDRGVVHRDVKPGNILGAGVGRWKLADFGVAHVPDSSLTLTGQFIGSPAYAAPEALTRGELGPAADVYGLGAALYQAASGRWPRSEPTSPGIAALLAPPPPLAGLAPHVPATLAAAIERALAPEPADRPSAEELARLLAEAPVTAASTGTPPPSATPMPAGTPMPAATPMPAMTAATAAVSLPPPPPPFVAANAMTPWRRHAPWIAIGLALGIAVVVALGGDRRDEPTARTPLAPLAPGAPASLRVVAPPDLDGKAARDWNKLVDKLHEQKFDEARAKLDDFERKHGRTAETADLAAQLEQLGYLGRGPEHPRGRGHDDD